ncbi:serine hydrolase domain-containing protein [Hufsiella ginkgonis]|uniref:Serine hydrolase n=1 Tax=Hufsiella ginkgonis TaxID=2695274 RepID=A0A7K1Y0M0_9SPHI|nr:serine hydrolase domain-containing protein [Hufsiella ginkgonis]MXV16637.1 serine hydrolase [Hufsiella ginkgonis]
MKTITLSFLISLLGVTQLFAQEQKGFITKGITLSAKIASGQKHLYKVKLDGEQFAFLQVMQKGADVKITTFDLEGNKTEETDSPNGIRGPEYVMLRSSAKGDYRVEIEGLGTNGPAATYELTLKIVRPKAVTTGQKIDEIFLPWDNQQSPAAAVAVFKGGKILYQKGYGMANLENHIRNAPSTMFHIASITKTFTGYGVLLLEKQGKLSLDEDIRKYLPEVPDFGHKISLRQLLQHTSGIRTFESLAAMSGYEIHSKLPFFKLISRQRDLNFLPGAEYDYSNTGFVLLAAVIERVSGMSYVAFVQEHIFKPLKMAVTVFQDDDGKLVPGVADSYEPGEDGPKKLYVVNDLVGSTGIITNVSDLGRWALHLLKPGADADIVRKMSTPGKLNDGRLTEYGLGLAIANYKGHKEIGHSGAEGGFKAHMSVFPDDDLVVIVLANASDIYSRPVARQIADIYLKPKKEVAAPASPAQPSSPAQAKPADIVAVDSAKADLTEYAGTYYSDELETAYQISIINGKLTAQHVFLKNIEFSPDSRDVFIMDGWNGKVDFVRDDQQGIKGCKFSYNRMRNLYFRKVDRW